ncbi:hypothetical protein ACH4D5_33880 [Streptomyces sp. NPDC018029]|uniref:hypothetical protein n=1 Tax=Streptomyces sp. NPDC018029 TaxID=3365032 RepID=UPI0037A4D08E
MSGPRPMDAPRCCCTWGDWDGSGEGVERDWVARTGCWSGVERVLLTRDQVEEYGLLPTAGKAADPRWAAWARRHGYDRRRLVRWEVEVLDAAELQRLVLAAVERHVDRQALAVVVAEEARQCAALSAFVSGWAGPGRLGAGAMTMAGPSSPALESVPESASGDPAGCAEVR